jgi:mannitol-1-phosphate/altronate dehydrogenase
VAAAVAEHLGNDDPLDKLDHCISFPRCVVDRMCLKTALDADSEEVIVTVEPYARWVIERTAGSERLEEAFAPLIKGGTVKFVSDIQPYRIQKLWLVNAPHLLVAILSKLAREPRLDVFLRSPHNELLLKRIQAELMPAVQFSSHLSLSELRAFNDRIVCRFQECPDRPDRILSRFRRSTLDLFLRDLDIKVGDPVRVLLSKPLGESPNYITRTIYQLLRLIRDEDYVE